MSRAPTLLFLLLLALTAAAGGALALGSRRLAGQDERAAEFQHLVGGLGFGPALDLSTCPFAFDPRLDSACAEDGGPIPAGASFCPYHACSVLDCPAMERGGADALLP